MTVICQFDGQNRDTSGNVYFILIPRYEGKRRNDSQISSFIVMFVTRAGVASIGLDLIIELQEEVKLSSSSSS